jgi:hypothetical protein
MGDAPDPSACNGPRGDGSAILRAMKLAIEGTCLCGAVTLGATRRPRQVTQCNCSVCRRYGTLWAYYRRSAVSITAPRGGLVSFSVRKAGLRFVRCKTCGCVVCWDSTRKAADRRFGLNTRLLDHALMANVPIKVLDGDDSWTSLEIYRKPDLWISPRRAR